VTSCILVLYLAGDPVFLLSFLHDALPIFEVARIDAQRWAISARGFNSFEASNKLLVLIDGRTVYTPLYSGVFWDQQHVALEDIRSEEHTSELQSRENLVCRLLLEKKKRTR